MSHRFLIIGEDSTLGGELARALRDAGEDVIGTTRRANDLGPNRITLSLTDDLANWVPPDRITTAYICAAVTNLERCRADPIASRQVNVRAPTTLVRTLLAEGTFVVFLSSSRVFDGTRALPHELDQTRPIGEYGRQKADAERSIMSLGDGVAIVRMTKVLRPSEPLFTEWLVNLSKEIPITPFDDMVMAPVPLQCAVSVLTLVGQRQMTGVLHVSGERDVTYADIAYRAADLLGVPVELVRPRSVNSAGIDEPTPQATVLATDRLRTSLGIVPPPVNWTIRTTLRTSAN